MEKETEEIGCEMSDKENEEFEFRLRSEQEEAESSVSVSNDKKESKSEVASDIATNIRTAIGKVANPMKIGADVVSGRIYNDDPLAQAGGEIATSALNTAAFGIPKAMTKKILETNDIEYPEIENKVTKTVGELIGLIVPGKVATSVATKIPGLAGRTIAKDIARGATSGGIMGFTVSPDEFMDINQRIKQAGVGTVVGAVAVPISKGIENVARVAVKAKDFAQKVRTSLLEAKQSIGKTFESQLEALEVQNPNTVVNLSRTFEKANEIAKTNARFERDLIQGAKRSGLDTKVVKGYIANPDSASQMTLNQSRELKQAVSKIPSIATNLKKGKLANYSDTDIDLLDFADDIKSNQLEAFPQLEGINKKYSEMITQYNMVKDKFRVGKLLDNIEKNFGDAEIKDIVKQLLPKEIIQEMGGYRAGLKFLNAMKWISIVGAGTGIAALAGKKLFGGGASKYQEG